MKQRVVEYRDFNGVDRKETLDFHISKARILENWDIVTELESIQATFVGDKREMTPTEIMRIVLLVKRVMRLGYGKRSDDGLRFSQKPEIWDEFEESAAYDKFMMDLFTSTPEAALEFVNAIFPVVSDREDLKAQAKAMYPHLFDGENNAIDTQVITDETTDISNEPVTTDDRPAWLRENRAPTNDEFKKATPEQKLIAFEMRGRM